MKSFLRLICFWRLIASILHAPMTSCVPMAAARTICVSMEEPALRFVSPQVFGTTVPVLYRLLENTVRLSWKEAVRITKQPDPLPLDCIHLTTTKVKSSRCSAILIQSPGSHGTWLSRLVYPALTTVIFLRYLNSLWIFCTYLIHERRRKAHSAVKCEKHTFSCCFHNCFVS